MIMKIYAWGRHMADQPYQRKLAAIFYADVAGYSRLTGLDEDATHEALRSGLSTLTRAIEGRGGKVNHYAGDAILAEFGSVVGCVEMAVEVQRRFRDENRDIPEDQRLLFRIGIHMSEVIDDDGEIYGDGVNIAARLESLAEPGGICLTGIVADQVRHRLDITVEDMGEHRVKNIELPIRAYRVGIEPIKTGSSVAAPEKPAIAVLPFDNLSSDLEQEYFSDGITEDIITALSRIGWLQVTARNSTFSYKGQSPDLRDVAKDLNVRYVLEGSVRKAGDRLRISAQLIDGSTGSHIWAESYDRNLIDIFDLQDEITGTVAGAIEPELTRAERERSIRKHPANIDAWDLYQRGMQGLVRPTPESLAKSEDLFRQSISLDPNLPQAHTGVSRALGMQAYTNITENRSATFDEAIAEGRRAVELGHDDVNTYWGLGAVLVMQGCILGRLEQALPVLEQGLAVNPNSASIRSTLGRALVYVGRANEGIKHIEAAMRLSPRDILAHQFLDALVIAHFSLGDYDRALEMSTKARNFEGSATGSSQIFHFAAVRIAALAHLGQVEDARAECEALQAAYPDLANIIGDYRISCQEDLIDGLRKAGLEDI